MNYNIQWIQFRKGFTLLEVIITLMVAAIMGTALVSFLGTSVKRSGEPVIETIDEFHVSEVMEKITSDYRNELGNDTLTWSGFINSINTNYGALVDSITASFIERFTDDNSDGIFDYITGDQNDNILLLIVTRGEQTQASIFTR